MQTDEGRVLAGGPRSAVRVEEVSADHHCLEARQEEHEDDRHSKLNPDHFVVEGDTEVLLPPPVLGGLHIGYARSPPQPGDDVVGESHRD